MAKNRQKNKIGQEVPVKKTDLHVWEKLTGKHHLKTPQGRVVIKPGEIVHGGKDEFLGDNTWIYRGPVDPELQNEPEEEPTIFTKEEREDGFYVLNRLGNSMNDEPFTEEEADEFINAALDN